ncbi:TIGR00341 family protein [Halococcus saccharolyticus]|uniref:TIGR00341 family protein n=1 Tax=Halococcus saccharolyticus DSM 5350 TaxID=1227455 RepID=M0MND9_9EURY|nr:TIGR00341 family protein [Halococcus saccharolyticus]EMA46259.1 hypothetical protein C449_04480 [Halococcus saccharolyticus DSM 5350]
MRLVQVTIPAGKREAILRTLDDEGIDYVLTEETSGREFTGVVSFPLPTTAVEPVLDRLRETGIDEDAYTVVLDAETVVSRRFDQLEERYDEEDTDKRIAREELHARARELVPTTGTYLVMTIVSAVVATAGLLLDSPAVVVGSMVIAPLIGPAMSTAVGTVVDDREMFRTGLRLQAVGLAIAIVAATAFAGLARVTNVIPPGTDVLAISQVRGRLTPDFLSLAVALGAGVAGAASLASGVSAAIVGVMIAAALVPPLGVIGIGIAWGLPGTVLGSTVLVLVNVLSINVTALAVLWYRGYRPDHWFKEDTARRATRKRVGALVAAILVLSLFLGVVTYDSYRTATFEQEVRGDVEELLDQPEYEQLTLLNVQFGYDDPVPPREPTNVTVVVGQPPDSESASLAAPLDQRIDGALGTLDFPGVIVDPGPVDVQVRYVEIESA